MRLVDSLSSDALDAERKFSICDNGDGETSDETVKNQYPNREHQCFTHQQGKGWQQVFQFV